MRLEVAGEREPRRLPCHAPAVEVRVEQPPGRAAPRRRSGPCTAGTCRAAAGSSGAGEGAGAAARAGSSSSGEARRRAPAGRSGGRPRLAGRPRSRGGAPAPATRRSAAVCPRPCPARAAVAPPPGPLARARRGRRGAAPRRPATRTARRPTGHVAAAIASRSTRAAGSLVARPVPVGRAASASRRSAVKPASVATNRGRVTAALSMRTSDAVAEPASHDPGEPSGARACSATFARCRSTSASSSSRVAGGRWTPPGRICPPGEDPRPPVGTGEQRAGAE